MTLTATSRVLKDRCCYLPDPILCMLSIFSAWQGQDRRAMIHQKIQTTLTNQSSTSQKQYSSHVPWNYAPRTSTLFRYSIALRSTFSVGLNRPGGLKTSSVASCTFVISVHNGTTSLLVCPLTLREPLSSHYVSRWYWSLG